MEVTGIVRVGAGALTRRVRRCALSITIFLCATLQAGIAQTNHPVRSAQGSQIEDAGTPAPSDLRAEQELQQGTQLTQRGDFVEAIPHLLAVRGHVANEYAASFNLALCYVGTIQFAKAIPILSDLQRSGHDNADVNNLLAQAYIGDSQNQKALDAFQKAASVTPSNEKLYMFVADACMGKQAYALGLQVVELGLRNLPESAKLHFERGMFLTLLDRFDEAKSDFDLARKLAPESDTAYLAGAQQAMFEGNIADVIRIAREGISKGHENFMLLTLLGEALLRSGIAPGQKEFDEARQALEKSVAERANYSSAQLALGKLYLLDNQAGNAVAHLETARQLNPENSAVYSNLAAAYRKQGDRQKAQDALAMLAKLNQIQAERISNAPGDRKPSYAEK